MTIIGSFTTIQCSGISNNQVISLNATSVVTRLPIYAQTDFVTTKSDFPNSEVDWLGFGNRLFDIRGIIDIHSPKANDHITVSGLYDLVKQAGSYGVWFYDEGVFGNQSGCWVKPRNQMTITRNNDTAKSAYQVGYRIDYSIELVETA